MIKFNLINSYTENLFFFVSNLSEFHFSCRKEYNEEWQKIFGKINKEEAKLLGKFRVVLKKHGFNKDGVYLGVLIFTSSENQKLESLEKILSARDFALVKETLKKFEPKFKQIYKKNKIDEWIKIQTEILESDRIQNAIKEMVLLLGAKLSSNRINIHLLGFMSPNKLAAGGANLGPHDITLEMPVNRIETWIGEWGVFVALHELAHLMFENSKAKNILSRKVKAASIKNIKNIKPQRDPYNLMKELIIELCAPSGYICEKNSKNIKPLSEILVTNLGDKLKEFEKYKKGQPVSCSCLLSYIVWQTYPLVSLYVNKKKSIDSDFIDSLLKILEAGA
jgi:hypothetical protein